MTGLALLIPVALSLGLAGLAAFFWALSRGQFDDMDGAALRILIDDDEDGKWPSAGATEGREVALSPWPDGGGQNQTAMEEGSPIPSAQSLIQRKPRFDRPQGAPSPAGS